MQGAFGPPIANVEQIDLDLANRLLAAWGHTIGEIERPYGMEAYGLHAQGHFVSVAVSASTISATAADYHRQEIVECARLCSDPAENWATRVMLRLWRECCAPLWHCWPVLAAVSYHQSNRQTGNLYRFDGWEKVAEDCGSSGGGTWTKEREADAPAGGPKTLWLWRYDREAL